MRIKFIKIAIFAFVLTFFNKSVAQVEIMKNYVFSPDSLVGFDEQAASAAALLNGCYGSEYKFVMYKAKRSFIKQRYNLPTLTGAPITLFQNPVVLNKSMVIGGACDNEDFELATTNIVA